jgi:hypothetical protein
MQNYNKFAGWALCLASLLLLATLGKLDLLIVLLPLSILCTFLAAGLNRSKDNTDGRGGKEIA